MQSKKKATRKKVVSTRSPITIKKIDKELIRSLLKTAVLEAYTKTGSPIGFIFDMDSIVTSSGQLVGTQSTLLASKGATIAFYIECLYAQFEITQKNDLKPTHENLEKLNNWLKSFVADQIFAVESRPSATN